MWFFLSRQAKFTEFVKKTYLDYFGVNLSDHDKLFAPHVCCKTYVEKSRGWRNGKRKTISFAFPISWREGTDQITDCYFCMINLKAMNRNNQRHIQYPDFPSVIRSIPHGSDFPIPESNGNMKYSFDSKHSDMTCVAGDDAYTSEPILLT